MISGSNFVAVTRIKYIVPVSSKEFLEIQATIECRFTLKRVGDMLRTYMKCTVQISTQNTAQLFGQFGQKVERSFKN